MEQKALHVNKSTINELNKMLAIGWKVVSVTALFATTCDSGLSTPHDKVIESGAIVIIEKESKQY